LLADFVTLDRYDPFDSNWWVSNFANGKWIREGIAKTVLYQGFSHFEKKARQK
jgi:hypothetical protein